MTISVSTFDFSASIPECAWFDRLLPSKEKGLVTTPTVRAPKSFAICAITGAAPVPVPPPIPAVTKIMSAPCKASSICSLLSRSEEHTSELQSRGHLVCRLLLEKKNKTIIKKKHDI